jgi:hypothetical protein
MIGGQNTTWKHGTNGAVSSNTNFTTSTMALSANFGADEADGTVFGDAYREYEQTFKNATISATYYYSVTVWNQLAAIYNGADSVTFEIGPNGTTAGYAKITGSFVITSLSMPLQVGDVIKFDVSMRVNGAVVFTTF